MIDIALHIFLSHWGSKTISLIHLGDEKSLVLVWAQKHIHLISCHFVQTHIWKISIGNAVIEFFKNKDDPQSVIWGLKTLECTSWWNQCLSTMGNLEATDRCVKVSILESLLGSFWEERLAGPRGICHWHRDHPVLKVGLCQIPCWHVPATDLGEIWDLWDVLSGNLRQWSRCCELMSRQPTRTANSFPNLTSILPR